MKSIFAGARGLAAGALCLVVVMGAAVGAAVAAHRLTPEQEKRLVNAFNRAQEKSLQYLPGMTDEAVKKVVAHRKAGKKFSSAAEVRSVAGLTEEQYDALAKRYATLLSDKSATSTAKQKEGGGVLARRMKARAGGAETTEEGQPAEEGGGLNLEVRAKYYSILPGYDLSGLSDKERHAFLETINTEMCPCGCQGETLGYCLVNDPGCMVVKARVKKIYKDITGQDPTPPKEGSER